MKKLNTNGFAHHVATIALVVVFVIGGIGSYIYLSSSSAATPKSRGLLSGSYCPGKFIASVSNNSEKLSLYQISKTKKEYCGKLESIGSYKGKKRYMDVTFGSATKNNTSCAVSGGSLQSYDRGNYSSFAGPIKQKYNKKDLKKSTCVAVNLWGVTYLDKRGRKAADTNLVYNPSTGKVFKSKVNSR